MAVEIDPSDVPPAHSTSDVLASSKPPVSGAISSVYSHSRVSCSRAVSSWPGSTSTDDPFSASRAKRLVERCDHVDPVDALEVGLDRTTHGASLRRPGMRQILRPAIPPPVTHSCNRIFITNQRILELPPSAFFPFSTSAMAALFTRAAAGETSTVAFGAFFIKGMIPSAWRSRFARCSACRNSIWRTLTRSAAVRPILRFGVQASRRRWSAMLWSRMREYAIQVASTSRRDWAPSSVIAATAGHVPIIRLSLGGLLVKARPGQSSSGSIWRNGCSIRPPGARWKTDDLLELCERALLLGIGITRISTRPGLARARVWVPINSSRTFVASLLAWSSPSAAALQGSTISKITRENRGLGRARRVGVP